MTRSALLAATLALAACSPEAAQTCPGEGVFDARFVGSLVATARAGLDPDPALPPCAAAIGFPGGLPAFDGTLAADAASSAGALCRASGQVLFGTRSDGNRWVVEASSAGAALAACGRSCAATSRVVISGDLLPDAVTPAEFRGALVEQLTPSEGACDACDLPCAARYDLDGARVLP